MSQCRAYLPSAELCPNEATGDLCAEHLRYRDPLSGERLGFNLIVKNEEKVLERCLKSIRAVADEIVVTDTGSDDDTVKIALEYADKVFFTEWQDDFSGARNWSLQNSMAEWICWIDADESLPVGSVQALEQLKADDQGMTTAFVPLISELPGGRGSKHYLPKLFRRGTAHFEGIVHNQLIHSEPVTIMDALKIYHTGYNLDAPTMERKRARTITLLRKQLEQNPNDFFAMMNLGRTLLTSGKHAESLEVAEQGLKLENVPDNTKQMLYYNIAACHIHLKNPKAAREAVWECLRINAENVDMLFYLGWIACIEQKWARATVYLNRYLQAREAQDLDGFNLLILDFWDAEPQTMEFLSIAYQNLRQFDRAIEFAEKGVSVSRYDFGAWERLATLLNLANRKREFEACLREMVNRGLGAQKVILELAQL